MSGVEIVLVLLTFTGCAVSAFLVGWHAGKRAGLRSPLPERLRAARADLSRSDAALGELPPRVRSSDQSRSQRRLRSW